MSASNLIVDTNEIALNIPQLFEQMPCAIGIKTADSVYVAANQQVAGLTGFTSPKQMIGIKDENLNCPAAELHQTFVLQDQEALDNDKISNLDVCKYSDGQLHVFLSVKKKLIDEKNQHFILFTMTELPIVAIAKIMTQMNSSAVEKLKEISASYRIENTINCNKDKSDQLLSKRLSECLFLLLQGKSMKAIAYALKISARTVEDHIDRLKLIFDCYTKSQLVEKAFTLGYAQIIPPSLLYL